MMDVGPINETSSPMVGDLGTLYLNVLEALDICSATSWEKITHVVQLTGRVSMIRMGGRPKVSAISQKT